MLGNSNIDEVEIKIEVLTDKNGRFDHPLRENSVFPRQKKSDFVHTDFVRLVADGRP